MPAPQIALYISKDDAKSYFPKWRQLFAKHFSAINVSCGAPLTLAEIESKYPKCDWIVCATESLLAKVIATHATMKDSAPSLENYAGSVFPLRPGSSKKVLIIRDLKTLYTIDYMPFLMEQHLAKIFDPKRFLPEIPFTWEVVAEPEIERVYDIMSQAILIGEDIETLDEIAWPTAEDKKAKRKVLAITESGHAALIKKADGTYHIHVAVIPFTSMALISLAKRINQLPAAKVMHNGHYDCSYYMRYNMPPVNYCYDTYNLQHCFFSELPKTLAFTSAFWVPNVQYWKEDRKSQDKQTRFLYNAKDNYYTVCALLNMMHQCQDKWEYVFRNYELEFRMVFPAINAGTYGLLINEEVQKREYAAAAERADVLLTRLRKLLRADNFNPSSPQQVLKLYKLLTEGKACSTEKKTLKDFKAKYPLFAFFANLIEKYREERKAVSTYYGFEQLGNRLLYKIDCAGTETGRGASKASDFWCGTQIQNIPKYAKRQCISETGWAMAELDKSQSESRTTAYLAQDLALIDAVENSPDFHCHNCSLFFGIPFTELFQVEHYDEAGNYFPEKVLREDIRTLGKRVNHGANYNMGPAVLIETMGEEKVFEAARLLNLPSIWSATKIATFLLACFERAYPKVKRDFQYEIINEVRVTGYLTLPNGWTRKCFGRPWERKPDLNAYIAHKPQSLSVHMVNDGWFDCWLNLQIRPFLATGHERIRIHAQIHDSILFSYRPMDKEIFAEMDNRMRVHTTIHGRHLVIPNDIKYGSSSWGALKEKYATQKNDMFKLPAA